MTDELKERVKALAEALEADSEPVSQESCETCKFWDEYEPPLKKGEESSPLVPDEGYGECRRFPPVLRRPLRDDEDAAETSMVVRPVMFWAQPCTTGEDWCGEWRAS